MTTNMTPANVRKTVLTDKEQDREKLMGLLLQVFTVDEAMAWLDEPNDFLGGGTPLETFHRSGAAAVAPAINAHRDGTFSSEL